MNRINEFDKLKSYAKRKNEKAIEKTEATSFLATLSSYPLVQLKHQFQFFPPSISLLRTKLWLPR